jgi:CheY-like chemotaxis protein
VAAETKKRVLVVDDEPSIQDVVRALLERTGLEVVAALDVSTAVLVLRSKPMPDLVLLDLMMPDVSGFELLRQMRATPIFDKLPIIILSAVADPDQIRKGLEMGADRYVTKTYLAHSLARTVQEVIRSGRRPK